MSNSARLTLIAFSALVLPACYSSGNHTTMTPVGPPGSPDAFARTSPAHNATGVSTTATFMGAAANGAATSRIQIPTSPAFGTTVVDAAGLTNNQYTAPTATLSAATVYYWRVIASNASGDTFTTA
jgi:hypothetical protein